ncbi:MAG: xanthine dehydrogenase family protein subunit M [Chloroflexi bacterium]|nr:MAG: xanthine dehydrogenase family protein subunit M [Chloroflexota bacterium]
MQALKYARASSVDEAVQMLRDGGPNAKVLAGGTDIIVLARERRRKVEFFVDIKHIAEVMALEYDATKGLTVGSATPLYRVYNDANILKHFPALTQSAHVIGGTAIQGRASLGGNLANSGPAGDSITAMMALNGTALIAGPGGRREVKIDEFCTGPGQNVLQTGEFIVSLHFPHPAAHSGSAWERFIPRNEMDIAVANSGTYLVLDGDVVTEARIALGAVGPKVFMVPVDSLVGKPLTDETIAAAGQAAKATATPIDDMRGSIKQRLHLSDILTQRTIRAAAERARA